MSLFATFSLEQRNNAFIQKLRLHPRSTVLRLSTDAQERSATEQLLERELLAAVFVAKNELTRGKKK